MVPGSGPDAEKCPGLVGAKVAFRMVHVIRAVTTGVDAPGPAAAKPVQKVAEVKTVKKFSSNLGVSVDLGFGMGHCAHRLVDMFGSEMWLSLWSCWLNNKCFCWLTYAWL